MKTLIFLWDNFGPTHSDRVEAVTRAFSGRKRVIGIEERTHSDTYDWLPEQRDGFEKITLFGPAWPGTFGMLGALIKQDIHLGRTTWFLCNYDRLHIFLFAIWLRVRLRKVYLMADSKYDDFPRFLFRELGKSIALMPYMGAIARGTRSQNYMRFLLGRNKPVVSEYDTLNVDRIRSLSGAQPAPEGMPFTQRDWIIVARLVEKKNLFFALDAYAAYLKVSMNQRRLRICGSGPLDAGLKDYAKRLGISQKVDFLGFVQTDVVSSLLASSIALILPSVEEQFGLVTIEAQAMGLPVLISDVCGARDHLVRNWINGFVFEPDNIEGLARFMALLDNDDALWRKLCEGAQLSADKGHVTRFVEAVENIV